MGMRNDSFRAVFQGANLISRKQVDAGIRQLESIRDGDPDREIVGLKHVQPAIAYGRKKLIDRSDHHWHKAIEYDHFTGIAYEKLAISLTREPFAKFARKRDLLSGRVVVPGKPMASQVQIPFEGVILQEHSAPISCPTPNFAKGSRQGRLDEAIEVCDALIRHPTIPRKGSYLTKEAMRIRRDKLLVRRAKGLKRI